MSNLKKKIDKKVNFEFNREYIKVIEDKIQKNDVNFISNSFKGSLEPFSAKSRIWNFAIAYFILILILLLS